MVKPNEIDRLSVARDADRSVVATSGVSVRGQRKRTEFGGITVITGLPGVPGRSRYDLVRTLAGAAVFAAFLWCGAGMLGAPNAVALTISLIVGIGSAALMIAYPDSAGTVVVRGADDHISLVSPHERKKLDQTLELAERVAKTWPLLGRLIDTDDARRLLVSTVRECARLLAKREKISALLAEANQVDGTRLAAESRAAQNLSAVRKKAEESRRRIDVDLGRQFLYLRAVAEAGEQLAREQEMTRTVDNMRAALDELSADDSIQPSAASVELSDRTAAVIAAYRELEAHYGTRE